MYAAHLARLTCAATRHFRRLISLPVPSAAQCMTVIVSEGKEELWKCLGFDNPNQQEEEEEEDQHQGSQQLLLQATNEVHGFSWLGPRWACGLSQHLSSTVSTGHSHAVQPSPSVHDSCLCILTCIVSAAPCSSWAYLDGTGSLRACTCAD